MLKVDQKYDERCYYGISHNHKLLEDVHDYIPCPTTSYKINNPLIPRPLSGKPN